MRMVTLKSSNSHPLHGSHYKSYRDKINRGSSINYMFVYKEELQHSNIQLFNYIQ